MGQDEASCVVYGMPRSCAEMGVLKRVVPLGEVPWGDSSRHTPQDGLCSRAEELGVVPQKETRPP